MRVRRGPSSAECRPEMELIFTKATSPWRATKPAHPAAVLMFHTSVYCVFNSLQTVIGACKGECWSKGMEVKRGSKRRAWPSMDCYPISSVRARGAGLHCSLLPDTEKARSGMWTSVLPALW